LVPPFKKKKKKKKKKKRGGYDVHILICLLVCA
jgi:hypothetical protein